jgi:pyruvate/2-oxoglutarate dehydrogenase complex dihydrolipoamide acyltransferase (E2) component
MVVEIKVPTIADVGGRLSIGRWFKRVGDPVSIGELLVEIDTFDLTHNIQAPATGILSNVLVNDGGFVELGTVIGTIDQVRPAYRAGVEGEEMSNEADPLARFGLDAIDLRWTMKDIAAKRWPMLNQEHVERLIDLGLVEMRDDRPVLTIAGQNTVWEG